LSCAYRAVAGIKRSVAAILDAVTIEVAALGVGKAVASFLARRWMAGRAARQAASADLVELIAAGFPDDIKRRKAERQFDAIADMVAERLLPYIQQEFGGLDDGTRQAVLYQVVLTLDHADLSDGALLGDDMDPVKLARRLRVMLPAREAEFQLGGAGARLYDVVLDECCDCLARLLVHLPQFEPRAVAETLSRLSAMTAQMEAILSRLPVRTLMAPDGDADDAEFTRRYLATVSENLDRLELLGLRFDRFTRPQTTLSVAYISLNVSSASRASGTPWAVPVSEWRSEDREAGAVRVERVLSERRRMLIRGEAGGGKSTLLRWLAVMAARGGFTGELSAFNGLVPFLIKLRSYAGRPLPRPEEFLDAVAGNLAGIMPRGWAHRRLQSGRAMLLIDGVDEVIDSQRQAVREWLQQVTAHFPRVRVVVTSRPATAEAGWLDGNGFGAAYLEQLGPADLRALVHHWHDAVRDCADLPCAPERLGGYEAKLLARLESAPHLRTLGATPLLAAMLCALNLDREALPRDRMGLYAAALGMLLETRDAKRDVPSARATPLEREQKILILQDLAWHLSTSDRVELHKHTAERLIDQRLASMPQVRAAADVILNMLLQRSGVLREPVPGRIDFVHRTVQEYLAAKQAADLGDMDLLIRNAHQDHWRETIVMAAGHANEPLRRELVTGILGRARYEPSQARRLKLLAVACLETLPSVPDDLRAALDSCLDDLIPPCDDNAARALASAGEPVLGWLPKSLDGLSPAVAAATIRTAWLINGPGALDVLACYATDQHRVVPSELSRAWDYFDPEEYASRVLAAKPPYGSVAAGSPAQIAVLSKLAPLAGLDVSLTRPTDFSTLARHATSLRRLSFQHVEPGATMTALPTLPSLQSVDADLRGLTDLGFLVALPHQINELWLTNCQDIKDYSPLRRFAGLRTLVLSNCEQLYSLRQLPHLSAMRVLSLNGSAIRYGTLEALVAGAPGLVALYLAHCDWIGDLNSLAGHNFRCLVISSNERVSDLSPLRRQTSLSTLDVSKTRVSDLAPLQGLAPLQELRLTWCKNVSDLRPLAALPNLKELHIERVAPGVDLSPLAANQRLTVYIDPGQDVQGAKSLGHQLRIG
jgi:hypothetical protein